MGISSLKRYGVFGGSFDPPHFCHELIACSSIEKLRLDTLFVVPTFLSPFKDSFCAPPMLRFQWLCKIFSDNDKIEVLDIEIKAQKVCYTYDNIETIEKIVGKQSCDKIFLIIGSDNLDGFLKWHRHEELIKKVEPVVFTRCGTSSEFRTIEIDCPYSSSSFRESLDESAINPKIRADVIKFYKENR